MAACGFMTGPYQRDTQIFNTKGRAIAGNAIGVLVLDLHYPLVPGNVANATTFDFPLMYKVLEGTSVAQILSADPSLLDTLVEGAKELEKQGVRAIVGSCGYFGNYQREAAERLNVPVFLSSLLQIPIIRRALGPEQKVGVICGDAQALRASTLEACGVIRDTDVVIYGAQDLPEFRDNILRCSGSFNSAVIESQLVGLAGQLVEEHPEVGALLLECSDMPPYAWAIQNATGLPVFDYFSFINWVFTAMVRRPFAGFI